MKISLFAACIALGLSAAASAQSTDTPQTTRPDARYSKPSGQDSNPTATTVKPTTPAPRTTNPEDARTSTKGQAAQQTYSAGKKRDDAAGCSTPTTADRAGVKVPETGTRADGTKTVCTTSGDEKVPAKDSKKSASSAQKSNAPATRR